MIREAHVTHSRDGYALTVVEVPLWALVVERAGETVCEWTGSALCGARWEWPYLVGVGRDEDGMRRWSLGKVLFDFGQWFHGIAVRRQRERFSMPVTTEWVAEHFPNLRAENLAVDSDDTG